MCRCVILTGTDPIDPRGGIGFAMQGFREALERERLLATLIPSYRPDVPGGRTWWALKATGRIALAVRRLRAEGVTPVVYAHGGAAIGLLRQALLLKFVRPFGADTMLHVHSLMVQEYLESRKGRALLRFCLASADVVCVLSEFMRARLGRLVPGHSVAVVPDPLSPELEKVAGNDDGKRGIDGRLRLLTMTRIVPGKGVELAIRSLAELPPDVELTVAGEGSELPTCERLAGDLGLVERVRFTGWVDGEAKSRLLRSSDVFLLPTRRDSFGMGFVEAMAHGMPVVALNWGPIPEVVPHGSAGILVNEADPRAIADAVKGLADHRERARMGRAGRRWVLERFSADVVGRKLRSVLSGLRAGASATSARPRAVG